MKLGVGSGRAGSSVSAWSTVALRMQSFPLPGRLAALPVLGSPILPRFQASRFKSLGQSDRHG
jgi:hypothetical protein